MQKKRIFLVIILAFFINLKIVMPVNDGSVEKTFDEEIADITPPLIPDDKERFSLDLTLKDYNTKNIIGDIHVNINRIDLVSKKEINTLQYVDKNGILRLMLNSGSYEITLKIDDLTTSGKDYFIEFKKEINANYEGRLYLLPIGSIRGIVYDNKKEVIKEAIVNFDCIGDYGDFKNKVTDESGSFSSYWLPAGSCKISAISDDEVGYEQITLSKGELKNIEIVLSKRLSSKNKIYFGIIIIIFLILIYFILSKKIKKYDIIKETPKKDASKLTNRQDDIIKTLKEKENNIVDFLLKNNNESASSKIRYGLGIPKTSLSRVLLGLEFKNIIKIEKIGKLKKIKLTAWFLGKE